MSEVAPNYGEEWNCNYELRRWNDGVGGVLGGAEEWSWGGDPQFFLQDASRGEISIDCGG